MVQYLNNYLDTEDIIICINLIALWLGYVLEADGRFRSVTRFDDCRWWLNIVPILFAQLHTSNLDVADVSADLDSLHSETSPIRSNFLGSAHISQHCVSNGAALHWNRHRTPDFKVGSACWLVRLQGINAFSAVHGVADFSKIVHFEIILP